MNTTQGKEDAKLSPEQQVKLRIKRDAEATEQSIRAELQRQAESYRELERERLRGVKEAIQRFIERVRVADFESKDAVLVAVSSGSYQFPKLTWRLKRVQRSEVKLVVAWVLEDVSWRYYITREGQLVEKVQAPGGYHVDFVQHVEDGMSYDVCQPVSAEYFASPSGFQSGTMAGTLRRVIDEICKTQ